jgi:diaminopimelate decarboxylase
MTSLLEGRLELFPVSAAIQGNPPELTIAGLSLRELGEQYGTPLYLYDETTLSEALQTYRAALAQHYPAESGITYAGKAFLCLAMAQWVGRQELWLDATGQGELHIAAAANLPRAQVLVHGVNKNPDDLDAALAQAGTLVVDNLTELKRLAAAYRVSQAMPLEQALPDLWLRVRPGLAVETHHAHTQTGQEDSKFGLSLDEVSQAVRIGLENGLPLTGIHFHQGSHFHDPAPLAEALDTVLDLVAELHHSTGWLPQALCPGGGWGVAYHEDELPHPPVEQYVSLIARSVVAGCQKRQLPLPRLQLEPGRSLVARGGVALYRVGAVKHTASRRWILLDGGMADNPRHALYGARYSALPVLAVDRPMSASVWLAGPFCESGDILIEGLPMPEVEPGEFIAIPVSGAYHLSMGSNYNGARKPAVLWLDQLGAHIIQRRETLDDLIRRDASLPG